MIELGNQALTTPVPGGGNATYPNLAASLNFQAGNLTLITTPIGQIAVGNGTQWVRSGRPDYDGVPTQIGNVAGDAQLGPLVAQAQAVLPGLANAAANAALTNVIVNTALLPGNLPPQARITWKTSDGRSGDQAFALGNSATPLGNLAVAYEAAIAAKIAAIGLPRKAV